MPRDSVCSAGRNRTIDTRKTEAQRIATGPYASAPSVRAARMLNTYASTPDASVPTESTAAPRRPRSTAVAPSAR